MMRIDDYDVGRDRLALFCCSDGRNCKWQLRRNSSNCSAGLHNCIVLCVGALFCLWFTALSFQQLRALVGRLASQYRLDVNQQVTGGQSAINHFGYLLQTQNAHQDAHGAFFGHAIAVFVQH